jgi:glycosyltransferase involved in cell wall biosynthesis
MKEIFSTWNETGDLMAISFLTLLGAATLVGYGCTTLEFILGNRALPKLAQTPLPPAGHHWPTVSVIIPARNEERHLEEALSSVLALDYPGFELVVLNDRSDDRTGEILNRMAQQYPQLRVRHIEALPAGWLGKNHALYEGAKTATGEILLFTDADIVMGPETLRRTVAYFQAQALDHLALMPEIQTRSVALSLFMNAFSVYFALYSRPWQVSNPKSKAFIGIGAFNMIRHAVYEQIGTHQAIALRPDDDMKLGKLVKTRGFRQAAGNGLGLLQVEWYASLTELVQGLMKNAFAGLEYNVLLVLGGLIAQFCFGVWPVWALFVTHGLAWWLNLLSVALMQLLCFTNARSAGLNRASGLFFPLSSLLMMYIVLRSTVITLWQNGIHWRGTYYALAELRANRI